MQKAGRADTLASRSAILVGVNTPVTTIEPAPVPDPHHVADDLEPERPGLTAIDVLKSWGPVLAAAIAIAFGIQSFIARPFAIPSPSMLPTIEVGDRVMVNRLSYQVGEVERGQVIVFDTPANAESNEDFFIKRVIGLPGDRVTLRDGEVYIGEQRMVEPYLAAGSRNAQAQRPIPGCAQEAASFRECIVPQGHVFVMGDNRNASVDSRVFGPVPIDTIVGRAAMRVWPPTELGRL